MNSSEQSKKNLKISSKLKKNQYFCDNNNATHGYEILNEPIRV